MTARQTYIGNTQKTICDFVLANPTVILNKKHFLFCMKLLIFLFWFTPYNTTYKVDQL